MLLKVLEQGLQLINKMNKDWFFYLGLELMVLYYLLIRQLVIQRKDCYLRLILWLIVHPDTAQAKLNLDLLILYYR